jgi:protein-S-isoprenylcysteine O-methyltransferase Ste14
MSPAVRLIFLAVAFAAWMLPFFIQRPKNTQKAVKVDPRARWGIALASVGFFLTYLHTPKQWASEFSPLRFASASLFGLTGIVLAWTAVRSLGRQWRIDAGLNADHELVRTGPYRIVRHPIYASMLCMLLMGIEAIGSWPVWPVALAFFIAGTEIRVRVEDGLLRERFPAEFEAWRRTVPAYVPFVR